MAHAVSRAIGNQRWTSDKRRQRGLAREVAYDREPSTSISLVAAKLINWEIDLSQGIADLGGLEAKVWQGLVQAQNHATDRSRTRDRFSADRGDPQGDHPGALGLPGLEAWTGVSEARSPALRRFSDRTGGD